MTATSVKTHKVEINARDYEVTGEVISLEQIRQLGNIPADHKVYHEIPEPVDDPEVTEGESIALHKLEKFYSVTPAISGGQE
jgi:hypothetical protein